MNSRPGTDEPSSHIGFDANQEDTTSWFENGSARRRSNAAQRTPSQRATRDGTSSTTPAHGGQDGGIPPSSSRTNSQITPSPGRGLMSARRPSSLRFEVRPEPEMIPIASATPGQPTPSNRSRIGLPSPGTYITPRSRVLRQRQSIGATPHKKAADKVKELRRRAMLNTPGRSRRLSGRIERNDPMENLRRLARNLAPKSRLIPSSSPVEATPPAQPDRSNDDDDDDDDLLLESPRIRVPLDSDSDEDYGAPEASLRDALERTRVLEEQDLTMHSVELPRRMAPEMPEDLTIRRRSSMFDGFKNPESDAGLDVSMGLRLDSSPQRRIPFADDSDFRIELPEEEPLLDIDQSTFTIAGGLGRQSGTQFDLPLPEVDDDLAPSYSDDGGDIGMPFDVDENPSGGYDAAGSPAESVGEEEDGEGDDDELEVEVAAADQGKRRGSMTTKPQQARRKGQRHALAIPDKHIKAIAGRFFSQRNGKKPRFSQETLDRLGLQSDWFFERLGKTLEAYAKHAGRKTIQDRDVHLVMKRYVVRPSVSWGYLYLSVPWSLLVHDSYYTFLVFLTLLTHDPNQDSV